MCIDSYLSFALNTFNNLNNLLYLNYLTEFDRLTILSIDPLFLEILHLGFIILWQS